MALITVRLDEETLRLVNRAAASSGVSRSRWIADAIRGRMKREWAESVQALAGAWAELPLVHELRAGCGEDVEREPL